MDKVIGIIGILILIAMMMNSHTETDFDGESLTANVSLPPLIETRDGTPYQYQDAVPDSWNRVYR